MARLAVPDRHRSALGKHEFIASTGSHEIAIARIVAGELLSTWRRQIHNLDRLGAGMDVLQLTIGSPVLGSEGHIPLVMAIQHSGIDQQAFLRAAAAGSLNLFVRVTGLDGHIIGLDDCEQCQTDAGPELIVPTPEQMSDLAVRSRHHGLLRLREPRLSASILLGTEPLIHVLFDLVSQSDRFFAPLKPSPVLVGDIELACAEVEGLRSVWAALVTPEQIAASREVKQAPSTTAANPYGLRPVSAAVHAFMADRSKQCSPDQARRIRAACDLFVELEGDPLIGEVTRDILKTYRDNRLPQVPAKENKVRLKHSTTSITASIAAISGTDWPLLSPNECVKRMTWLADMFGWLTNERWIDHNIALGLTENSLASVNVRKTKRREQDRRQAFSRDELKRIFSESWFVSGRGEVTTAGTFRQFTPFYYWGPLLGLFTGARINEIAQLSLDDFKCASGAWYIDFNEDSTSVDGDMPPRKRLKNRSSIRRVPLHHLLSNLGLVEYVKSARSAGYDRLFPELKFNEVKGYGKGAGKWFSRLLASYGWPRDGTKVFHSFRHTLTSECMNELGMDESLTAQISGHQRGSSILTNTYKKDVPPELINAINRLDFDLPPIANFDIQAGLQAVRDALGRKSGGLGAVPD